MLILQFEGEKEKYTVEFQRTGKNTVKISGAPEKTKGFYLSRRGHADKWDYTGYDTIYKKEGDEVTYSDNGLIYTKPKDIGADKD